MPADLVQEQSLHHPHNQQQRYSASDSTTPNNEFVYYPIGSIIDLVTSCDRRIPRAEVLFHDPLYNIVIVKYPASSGRAGLHDITFVRLNHAKRVELISYPEQFSANSSATVSSSNATIEQQSSGSNSSRKTNATFAAVAAASASVSATANSTVDVNHHDDSNEIFNAASSAADIDLDKVRARLNRSLQLIDRGSALIETESNSNE
ncbi:hypothetical protein BOX15_Mlig006695g1 [Macrostomum lignano]|uniref:Uncharacterized protein n=1 Tax=Macrostomum lignano TaxID=282301 RepID=A0A267DL43_9PLAT|nr:hypothetical protein BOX15_Mlig006695g1 [Macrostomum lignano]